MSNQAKVQAFIIGAVLTAIVVLQLAVGYLAYEAGREVGVSYGTSSGYATGYATGKEDQIQIDREMLNDRKQHVEGYLQHLIAQARACSPA